MWTHTGPLKTGLFSYPLDVYDSALLATIKGNSSLLFNCTSIEVSHQVIFDKFRVCSTQTTCPIFKQNLIDATKRSSSWNPPQYFCDLRHALFRQKLKETNIIILGGSVTAGQFTSGYACDANYEEKCTQVKNSRPRPWFFSWGHYLKEWFEVQKMDHVKVHLLATHGYSSSVMNEAIVEKLRRAGITSLGSSDLVLLDHSANDGLYLTRVKVMPLQRGLEGLIRKILSFSVSDSNRPRIVLMETQAYLPTWLPYYQDYQLIYNKVASYYKIPIWSIKDAVHSSFAVTHQAEYAKTLQHDESVRYDLHPGWHLHLFFADMVVSMLRHVMAESHCPITPTRHTKKEKDRDRDRDRDRHVSAQDTQAGAGSKTNKKRGIQNTQTKSSSLVVPSQSSFPLNAVLLPFPLFDDVNRTCDLNIKPLLDISAEYVMKNEPITGRWERKPASGAWDLRSEGRGRVGWIQEKDSRKSHLSSLTFYPDDPQRLLGSDGNRPHLIQIQYLRTYQNAGQVRIFVCGNLIEGGDGMVRGNLDALWQSYGNYKLSLPEIEYVVFPEFGFGCKKPEDMGIRFEYVNDIKCRSGEPSSGECKDEMAARTAKQKFKIISVKVCALSATN